MISSQYLTRISLQRDLIPSSEVYPFNLPIIRSLIELEFHPKVTFFVGENGTGKSTLLESIAVALGFNAEGGTKNFHFSTRASHSVLHESIRLTKGVRKPKDGFFLRAESFYNLATEIERLDEEPLSGPSLIEAYGGQSLHEQSHGESYLALLMNRFRGNGLYILDEPESALSPQRQLAVLVRIHQLVMADSQFIIDTHSPIIIAYPDAWIYECGESGTHRVEYQNTDNYMVAHDFLMNPQKSLHYLLDNANDH